MTVAFRRWKRPSVKSGGTLQSPGGLLAIDEVERIDALQIALDDVRRAGFADVAALLDSLRPEGQLYRIRFHRLGDDPRAALRARRNLEAGELDDLRRELERLGWARPVLELIAGRPGVVSTELATTMGLERAPFKQRVRRLKALGLTESLDVGYRLSPRGAAVLEALRDGPR